MKRFFYIPRLFVFCALGLGIISNFSCKKETYNCGYNIYYLPFGFAFKGFTLEEIDTLLLKRYNAGDGFVQLQSIDTLYIANFSDRNGTYYRNNVDTNGNSSGSSGFGSLDFGWDYELELLSLGTTIQITNIKKGDTSYSFTSDHPCSTGAGEARFEVFSADFTSPYAVSLGKGVSAAPPDNVALVVK